MTASAARKIRTLRVSLVVLLAVALFAVALPSSAVAAIVDDDAPRTAPYIPASPFRASFDGDSENGDIIDFYRFRLVPGQTMKAAVSGPRGAFLWLELYGPGYPETFESGLEETRSPLAVTWPEAWWDPAFGPYPPFPYTTAEDGEHYLAAWGAAGTGQYQVSWTVSDQPTFTAPVRRVSGADRYATAIEAAQSFEAADTVLLATGKNYADALSAAGLAGALDAPLLLTDPLALNTSVRDYIKGLAPSKVIIIGGTGAVFPAVKTALEAEGITVERIAGADRYETAARVAAAIETAGVDVGKAFVVSAYGWPDALAASPLAYSQKMPILLVRPTSVPPVTAAALASLGVTETVVVGGTGVVSDGVKTSLPSATRVSGLNRYATSAAIAEYGHAKGWGSFSDAVGIATGASFADALAGGIALGDDHGVLLLTQQQTLSTTALKSHDPAASPAASLGAHASDIIDGGAFVNVYGGLGAVSGLVTTEIDGYFIRD